ncbi:hypothetical protein DFH29DRAFT_925718 [Suillus ampliporus]|nr:hypothetical protein DFH29DRAFT_925718 [Suillus ampliporus]
MTSNTPPKISPVPAGIPAVEQAKKTMFQSDIITPDPAMKTPKSEEYPTTITTNLNTPGREFPGSYPRELENLEQEQEQQPRGGGSEGPSMATSVVQAAKQYIHVERTVETASAYISIPQGIKRYLSPDEDSQPERTQSDQQLSTSLPSSELKGAQPREHVGGVGSLPGNISESSVALLPDERANKSAQTPVILEKDESQTQGDNQEKSATFPVGAAVVAGKPKSSIPSKDPSSQAQSSQYGSQTDPQQLDTVPTTQQTDQHPATLSEPRPVSDENTTKHGVPEGQGETTESKAATTAVEGGAIGAGESAKKAGFDDKARDKKEIPARGEEAGVYHQKEAQQPGGEKSTKNKGVENAQGAVGEATGHKSSNEGVKHTEKVGTGAGGHDTDYHPAKLHPPRTGESADLAEAQSGSPVSSTSAPAASMSDSPKDRRVSFLDKVRGEAKIIVGKMSGKEGKVQEGKRIMHGEV